MDKKIFRQLRKCAEKKINQPVAIKKSAASSMILEAKDIVITNSLGYNAKMNIRYNSKTKAKTININVVGVGPICRLDVDGPEHRPVGRSHKHELETPECPSNNIPHAIEKSNLSGKDLIEVFEIFCQEALIAHSGIELE